MQRKFIPGSEWLYFRLYTGIKTADRLLADHMSVFVACLLEKGVIDKFFFIRYSDPDFHVRLRLHVTDPKECGCVFTELYSRFSECVDSGMVSKIMCDTYMREIERYGVDTMMLSEDVFHVDSEAILNLVLHNETQMQSWHHAFLLVDDMINAFISVKEDRCKFTLQLANSYRREFGFESSTFTKQLNDKYRSLRPQIEALMKRDEATLAAYTILEKRKHGLSAIAIKIYETLSNQDTVMRDNLLGSYVHMSMNRLFRSKNRLNELIVYDCLSRHYDSLAAREKYKS